MMVIDIKFKKELISAALKESAITIIISSTVPPITIIKHKNGSCFLCALHFLILEVPS